MMAIGKLMEEGLRRQLDEEGRLCCLRATGGECWDHRQDRLAREAAGASVLSDDRPKREIMAPVIAGSRSPEEFRAAAAAVSRPADASDFGEVVIDNTEPRNGGSPPLRQVRREPDPKAIACMEELLALARAGDVRASAFLVINGDGQLRFGLSGLRGHTLPLIGAIEQLKWEAQKHYNGQGDD